MYEMMLMLFYIHSIHSFDSIHNDICASETLKPIK